MMRSLLPLATCCLLCHGISTAAQVQISTDPQSGYQIYELSSQDTHVRIAPSAGANVFSIQVAGVEYLRQPEKLSQLPGVGYGTPVLYPTPNRVKGASFTFQGRKFEFPPNGRGNFIHGLVHRASWDAVASWSSNDKASVTFKLIFREGTDWYKLFPLDHTIHLEIAVTPGAVRWTYEVDNTSGNDAVPFGFALHPYFVYQGQRAETYLTIPATHWMESENQLPSGRLVPASELDYALGNPVSMDELWLDDVYWGMKPSQPVAIDFRDARRRVEIAASKEFTHLVVWTPDRPYFGIENQTCSTDAHNLHAAGKRDAAHLQICKVGQKLRGWVEYQFQAASE